MEPLRYFSLGSGSSGNCSFLGTSQYGLLVDAGVSLRSVKRELTDHGIPLSNLWGIFVTHDHSDHIKNLVSLAAKLKVPVYLTEEMFKGINSNHKMTETLNRSYVRFYKKGETIELRDFLIHTFPTPHDATDSVGFSFEYGDKHFVYVTDLGYITKEIAEHILKANYLVIEADYDETMLKNGPYPYPLKERVRSHLGHLSNDHTAGFLSSNPVEGLTHVFLCHLSNVNNTPEKAYNAVHDALEAHGIELKSLVVLPRTTATKLFILE